MAKKPNPSNRPRNRKPEMEPLDDAITEKKPGKLQKFFFWVVIPVLFALAIGLIIAEVTGTNVFEKAKTVMDGNKNNASENGSNENYDEQIVQLKAQLKEKEAVASKLQDQLDKNKGDAEKLEAQKKQLEKEVKKLQTAKTDKKTDSTTIIKTYEQMAPKSAAAVISAMSDEDAVKILKNLKPATLAPILEKMTPEKAAKFTEALGETKK